MMDVVGKLVDDIERKKVVVYQRPLAPETKPLPSFSLGYPLLLLE